MIGSILAGRFEFVEHLGDGAAASVWKALDKSLGIEVAIKLLHPHLSRDTGCLERLKKEVLAARRAQGAGVVGVHELVEKEGQVFLVQDLYVTDLAQKLQSGALKADQLVAIGVQVAKALQRAHRAGVLHRDIKPANILLDASNNAFLGDFGLARLQDHAGATSTSLLAGTIGYTAPEVLKGTLDDPRSDQYALATTLYELATKTLPFTGTPAMILERKLNGEVQAPAGLPEAIRAVLLRALSRDPAHRFASMADFAQALQDAGKGVMPVKIPEAPACTRCGAALVPGVSRCPSCKKPRILAPRSKEGRYKVHVYAPMGFRYFRYKVLSNNMDRFTFEEKKKIVETTTAATGGALKPEAEVDDGLARPIVEAADGLSEEGAGLIRDQLVKQGLLAEVVGPDRPGIRWRERFITGLPFLPLLAGLMPTAVILGAALGTTDGPPIALAAFPLFATGLAAYMLKRFTRPHSLLKTPAEVTPESLEPQLSTELQGELLAIEDEEARSLVAEVLRAVADLREAAASGSAILKGDVEDAALAAAESAVRIGKELQKLPAGEGVELRAELLDLAAGLRGSAAALRKNRAAEASVEGKEAMGRLRAVIQAAGR